MHHTRKTHNAHNETQRRLRRVTLNMSTVLWSIRDPIYLKKDRRKDSGGFFIRNPKCNSGYYRWAKRRLHRIWRRKSIDELTYTYKNAKGCSIDDLW